MESLTKNKLNFGKINELIRRALINESTGMNNNSVLSYKEIEQGCFNAIYYVELKDREVVLKTAPKKDVRVLRYEKNIMQAEVESIKFVKANTTVPVPEIYYYDSSKEFCDFEYFIMEKISGTDYATLSSKLSYEQRKEIEEQIGSLNNEINKIKGEKYGYFAQEYKQSDNWSTAFFEIISDILSDGRDADIALPVPYDEIESIFKNFIYSCDDVKESRLVHWDLWPANVLIKDSSISGIIDFERVLWADPLMEYYFSGIDDNEHFCNGYGLKLSELDKNARIRRALYNLYLYLVGKIECRYRGYENSPHDAWAEKCIVSESKVFEKF